MFFHFCSLIDSFRHKFLFRHMHLCDKNFLFRYYQWWLGPHSHLQIWQFTLIHNFLLLYFLQLIMKNQAVVYFKRFQKKFLKYSKITLTFYIKNKVTSRNCFFKESRFGPKRQQLQCLIFTEHFENKYFDFSWNATISQANFFSNLPNYRKNVRECCS